MWSRPWPSWRRRPFWPDADPVGSSQASPRAALMASSELDELVEHCDRIYVVHRGRISAELSRGITVDELAHECDGRRVVGAS